MCKVASLECNSRGDDCLDANSCAKAPSHSPWSTSPSSRAMHADHPLGRDLLMGRLCPSGFPAVVRTVASLYLMHGSLVSWVSPCWNWGCGLKTTSLYLLLLCGVPRPEASTPLPCRLLHSLPYRGYQDGTPFWHRCIRGVKPGRHPRPVNARGWSMPEVVDLQETPSLALQYFKWIPCSGSHHVDFGQRPRTVRYNFLGKNHSEK